MDKRILERRRLLRLFVLGSIALPAAALAGCAQGTGASRPLRRRGGGNNGGEKSGGGRGTGGKR